MIQFDEPAFNVYFDEVRDWGIAALERAAQGLACTTAVHICYGYGIKANNDWKKTLGTEWRQYEQTFPLLARSAIGQVSLECANSHVPIDLIGLLDGKDVLVGAIDVASDRVETPEDVAATIRAALQVRAGRSGSIPAPIAAWCRCPGTSRAASSTALGAGRPPWSAAELGSADRMSANHGPPERRVSAHRTGGVDPERRDTGV